MKTLAELKRSMKLGTTWKIQHAKGWEPPPRKISVVQSNSVGFETKKENGEIVTSWFYFPKASNIEFFDGWAFIYENIFDSRTQKNERVFIMKYKRID